MQRLSLIDQQFHHQLQNIDPHLDTTNELSSNIKRFRFSSLRQNRHSLSIDNNLSSSAIRNNSLDTSDRNEAYILAFQRELQNLPKNESPVFGNSTQAVLTNSLASIIRETFENMGTSVKRPRSCSVPRITLENFSSTLLQLPNSSLDKSQVIVCSNNPLIRSATSDGSYYNSHVINSGMLQALHFCIQFIGSFHRCKS